MRARSSRVPSFALHCGTGHARRIHILSLSRYYHHNSQVHMSTEAQTTAPVSDAVADKPSPPLVMQIVVRRDLLDTEGWGVGPLMTQVAHATAAILHETRELPDTQLYLGDLLNMRKAVLQVADERSLRRLSELLGLTTPAVPHHLWVEQPENIPTCLAITPNRRDNKIKKALDKAGCRLWKG